MVTKLGETKNSAHSAAAELFVGHHCGLEQWENGDSSQDNNDKTITRAASFFLFFSFSPFINAGMICSNLISSKCSTK